MSPTLCAMSPTASPASGGALKRTFDVAASIVALVLLSPFLILAALVVRLSGPGPVIYRTSRAGRDGHPFTMYKFRTMRHQRAQHGPRITGEADDRIFPAGRVLRRTKIDELPQLWNVLRGDMSIVGPRPEDPAIVAEFYTPAMRRTLAVRPGLTSPGSIFGTTHGDDLLRGGEPESAYVERVLGVKLALEEVYLERRSFAYDLRLIGRTIGTLVAAAAGRRQFSDPPELPRALALLEGPVANPTPEPRTSAGSR